MKFPDVTMSQHERLFSNEELDILEITIRLREFANSYEGIIIESEIASFDKNFGYIFRYDIINTMSDKNLTHPYFRDKGVVADIFTKLIIMSKDGQTIECCTIPILGLR